MEDKNEHIRYYILFDNHTQGMMLHELLCDYDIPNRIAPAPRAQMQSRLWNALLIHPDDIEAARTCIEENNAEYVSIVPLENQLHKKERPILLKSIRTVSAETSFPPLTRFFIYT